MPGYKLIYHDNRFQYSDPDGGPPKHLYPEEDWEDPWGWELYYLGGDPSGSFLMPNHPVEDVEDGSRNLVVPDPENSEEAILDPDLLLTLTEPQASHLQAMFDDLREKIGRPEPSTGPALAASGKCDVNGDGDIDTADALAATQMTLTGTADPHEAARADVAPPRDLGADPEMDPLGGEDGDGVVSGPDVLLILRTMSGDDVKSCDHTLI